MSFKVHNADFIADKLAAELLPHQEYREVFINSVEALVRLLEGITPGLIESPQSFNGRIEFDVDWHLIAHTGQYYVACADNGDAMSRDELEKYTTTLAVEGANANQSLRGNQGMGLKISGPTRHPHGVLIRSLKHGEAWMVQIGKDEEEGYGFIALGPNDEKVMPAELGSFPGFIRDAGHGTVVTFLGEDEDDETFPGSPAYWLFKYLNSRVFEPFHDQIDAYARQPSADRESWPTTLEEANALKSWNLAKIKGTGLVWRDSSTEWDTIEVPGRPSDGIPPATIHWYLLDENKDPSSRTYAGGSVAVLYQNELHDWRYGGQASATFARAGILYGKSRVGLVVEPRGDTVASDFARAHVLIAGTQTTKHDAWNYYAEYFREHRPDAILKMMADEQAKLSAEDPDRIKRINGRLKEVLAMLRPRRWRHDPAGSDRAAGRVTGAGSKGTAPSVSSGIESGARERKSRRGIGAVLADVDAAGETATEVRSTVELEPRWVTESEAEGMALVEANGKGLSDRAAALVGSSATTAGTLVLNRDFRGYQAIIAEANKQYNPEGDDMKAQRIADACEEWVEQKIIEAVLSMRQLENGGSWMQEHLDSALSPLGLTAAFMADRVNTWNQVKRVVSKI